MNQGFAFNSTVPFQFKAPEFSGKEGENFEQFINKLKVYLALIDEAYLKPMEQAELDQSTQLTDAVFITKAAADDGEEDEIDEEAKKRSRHLQWLFISMITGEAAKVIQTTQCQRVRDVPPVTQPVQDACAITGHGPTHTDPQARLELRQASGQHRPMGR